MFTNQSYQNKTINLDYYSVILVQDITERNRMPVKLRQNGTISIIVEENCYQYQSCTTQQTEQWQPGF